MSTAVLPALLKLPKKRRMEIAESLWLSVADDSMEVPIEHKRLLNQRMKAYQAGTLKTISHSELMRKLRSREQLASPCIRSRRRGSQFRHRTLYEVAIRRTDAFPCAIR